MRQSTRASRVVCGVLLSLAAVVLVGGAWGASPASAHPTDATQLTMTRRGAAVDMDLQVPLAALSVATGLPLDEDPTAAIAANSSVLRSLVVDGLTISSQSGRLWTVTVRQVDASSRDGVPQFHAELLANAPIEETADVLVIDYRLIVEQNGNHEVYVTAVDAVGGASELVGTINQRHRVLVVTLGAGGSVAFGEMVNNGIDHFRSGSDHLVFLTLVAASALMYAGSRRRRVLDLAVRTLMFTVGHSTSLALATAGVIRPPRRLVEIGIAVTILLGSLQLLRRLVPERAEASITLAFGFIHGFGFAGVLSGMGLRGWALARPTLGFNVGLEIAQLATAAAIAPSLWYLARTRWARSAVARVAAVLAVGWIVERVDGWGNPAQPLVDLLVASPLRLAITLAVVALLTAMWRRLEPHRLRSHPNEPANIEGRSPVV